MTTDRDVLVALYDRCCEDNPALAAWLNGSCEVVSVSQDTLFLRMFRAVHMTKVREHQRFYESHAERLLGRKVSIVAFMEEQK